MHKILAEAIAGMIPGKMARNRWRGILRYGAIEAARLKARLRGDLPDPEVYLSVCAIAKDEGRYFDEWIGWHLSKGVDRFFIYDNGSTDNTRDVLQPYIDSGVVEYRYWPGSRRQIAAYDDCIRKYRLSTRWLAFIDLDEFIVPVKDGSIPAFLKRFETFPAVEINWLVYGSGGAEKRERGTVMERFKFHSQPGHILNRHVKSIVDPRRVYDMIGCHEAASISGRAADSHGEEIRRNFREREPQQDVIRINHYAVKSFEEFLEKQSKGRASGKRRRLTTGYFAEYDLNDIEER